MDDESDVRDIFRELLREEGFQVALASEGFDALVQLAHLPRPCTLLLDLQMPGLDGPGLLRALEADAALNPGVRAIVVSAHALSAPHPRVLRTLRKPADLGTVLELLTQMHPFEE